MGFTSTISVWFSYAFALLSLVFLLRMSTARGLYLPPAVLSLDNLSWPARLVLAEILDLYKVNGQVWANDQHFVNRLPGLAKRTVGGAIKELSDGGYLVRDTNQSALHKRILTPTEKCQATPIPIADSATGSLSLLQNLQQPIADSAIDLPQNLQQPIADSADINYPLNTKGKEHVKTAASAAAPASISSKRSGTKKLASIEAGPDFQEFWDSYAKKEDTKKCKLRWQALRLEQRQAALAAVPAYVASTPDRKYRKNPLTWLNGECWQDEVSGPNASTAPRPNTPPVASSLISLELNEEFEAQQRKREQAEADERARRFRATYINPITP